MLTILFSLLIPLFVWVLFSGLGALDEDVKTLNEVKSGVAAWEKVLAEINAKRGKP